MPTATTKPRIIIIGAGMAGLAAANHLQANQFEVTILEARNRIGGRIWVDHSLGVALGRGAAWIHGTDHNPITTLAKNYQVPFAAVDFKKICVRDAHGLAIPTDAYQRFNQRIEQQLQKAKAFALQEKKDISLANALSKFFDISQLSDLEKIFFERKKIYFENYLGAGFDQLSAQHFDQEETLSGDNCILSDSYEAIIKGLAAPCHILHEQVVKEIKQTPTSVEISTNRDHFRADAVIVTVPLGVLKKETIVFSPALPIAKQEAIKRIGMGVFDITAIKFPRQFWSNDCHAMFLSDINKNPMVTFFNFANFVNAPILVAYTGGDTATRLEQYDDTSLLSMVMSSLNKLYGDIPAPEKYFRTSWASDPFSYGSYSYPAVGVRSEDYDALAAPIDRIYFAGEATCRRFPATTHGAYFTGIREAEKIIKWAENN